MLKNMSNTNKIFLFASLLLIITAVILAYSDKQKSTEKIETLQNQLLEKKEEQAAQNKNLDRLSKRYNDLYKQKNGTAKENLLKATNDLFSIVYEYNTSRKEDSVKSRKDKAVKIADEGALKDLFPSNADEVTPSVTTVSKLTGDPEVYMKSSDSNQLSALVLVSYENTIAGGEALKGNYLYKVEYNQFQNKFTSVKGVTETNLK